MAKASAKSIWIKRWKAESQSGDGTYTVALKNDQTYGCSCKAWIFQRAKFPNGHCKHIQLIVSQEFKDFQKLHRDRVVFQGWVIDCEERESSASFVGASPMENYIERE